jgi:hypothetical protein
MLTLSSKQISQIADSIYAERMRHFLNVQFPESKEIPPEVLDPQILELTERAACYKLILQTQVAPFIVAAWIMGLDFDEKFLAVKQVLEDLDMDSGAKAEWLWQFLDRSVGILEEGASKGVFTPN